MEPNKSSKRVAIIGAGVSGLAAIKSCLEEGLQPTCFERSNTIGGLWFYREASTIHSGASVYKSTVTNTSKEMMCYSDFPFPKDWPNFLHNSFVKKYCDMYAEKFRLRRHVRFLTTVIRLDQALDFNVNGRWIVTVKQQSSAVVTTFEFDAVMICTGMFNSPIRPDFPGLRMFLGKVLHTMNYRNPIEFQDKRVVVIGLGNSAVDAATEVSRFASRVYLSVRRGTWIFSRMGAYAYPFELLLSRRYHKIYYPIVLQQYKNSLRLRFHMIAAPLEPEHDMFCCEPVVSEELPVCILNGMVTIKGNPLRFTETGLELEDGSVLENIDYVIMGTGYRFKFPFQVACSALEVEDGRIPLYKQVFPLGLKFSTVSIQGAISPIGSVIPCVELQARWAVRVFKGLATLPSQTIMEAEVVNTEKEMERKLLKCHRHVDGIQYADSVAAEIGALPNFITLFFRHPMLALRCIFGPCVPYQYRLVGPGKWAGAPDAITTVWDRVLAPTRTRRANISQHNSFKFLVYIGIVVLDISTLVLLF